MKSAMVIFALLFCVSISAQNKKLRKSQAATVIQTVGFTNVQIDYSRPLTKGREIFGSLVPYNKIWRTGANFCTTIEVDKDILVEGKKLAKGKYSLYSIPKEGKWTIIINRKLSWGTQYDSSQDVMRFDANSTKSKSNAEAFTINFKNLDVYKSDIELAWADRKVSFSINTK